MRTETDRKTYFAKADYRGKERVFGIKAGDRSKHVYIIGKTGMGKSVLLENMAAQDIQNGNGLAFIDPHGEAAATLLDYVPEERIGDVIHFAPFDVNYPISFNVMEDVGYDKRHLMVSGLVSTFKKIWPDVWSPRMEYILTNVLFALLEYPDSTLLDVNRMLVNKEFRKDVISRITDPVVKSFWAEEFANYTDRYTQEATPAIQNKIGQFVSNPLIRNIIGQSKSSFNFRDAMDTKKILIMNLSKGRIGDTNSKLLGSMLIIKIYLAAMSRADTNAEELAKLPFFYFYVDEFQSFANETFADILSESRKYKLSLTIAHQYIGQMPDEVREAVFGNVGTMIAFRVGAEDSEVFEKEFSPTFTAEDMVSLGLYQVYLKLMIDGLASKPFSATTLPPIEKPPGTFKVEVVAQSRKTYAKQRAEVEEMILKRYATAPAMEKLAREFKPQGGMDKSMPYKKPEERFMEKVRAREPQGTEPRRPYIVVPPSHKPFTKAPGVHSNPQSPRERMNGEERRGGERREPFVPNIAPAKEPKTAVKAAVKTEEEMKTFAAPKFAPKDNTEQVSLNMLRSQNKKNETLSQNADELRKVLNDALESKNKESKKTDEKITVDAGGINGGNNPPEIPEDELKKILEIN